MGEQLGVIWDAVMWVGATWVCWGWKPLLSSMCTPIPGQVEQKAGWFRDLLELLLGAASIMSGCRWPCPPRTWGNKLVPVLALLKCLWVMGGAPAGAESGGRVLVPP